MTPSAVQGTVLQGTGGIWQILGDDGLTRRAALRGRLKQGQTLKLAVGDIVEIVPGPDDLWAIESVRPRASQLARRAPGGKREARVLVANLDQVVIVMASAKPEPNLRQLDRFLVIVEANDLAPRLVINKIDLDELPALRHRFAAYARIGYPMHFTSVKERVGLDELHRALQGRSSALTGPSGVGKSSLMNALYPGLDLRVGEISESVEKGRHTTVGALMHPLPDGGFVVDTPGLREVGLWGLDAGSIDRCFPEMRERLGGCRFADCSHEVEPECVIRLAVERGEIAPERYESYLKLRSEVQESPRF
jgi:ribosome biogenesis GTPase / thiamine phosphate phosphatase